MEIKYMVKEIPTKTLADISEGVPFRVDRYQGIDPSRLSLFEEIASDIYDEEVFMKVKSPENETGFDTFYVVGLSTGIFYSYNQTENFFAGYNDIVDENEYTNGTIFPANLPVIPVKATLTIEK